MLLYTLPLPSLSSKKASIIFRLMSKALSYRNEVMNNQEIPILICLIRYTNSTELFINKMRREF